jgi:Ca-activated chloride channel family protein
MKVKTLGLLACTGMFLSSLTVWSLTTPRIGPDVIGSDTQPRTLDDFPKQPPHEAATQFVSGNTLMVEGRVGFKQREADKDQENFVFLDITAKKDALGQASPLNLAIVLDRSGSMRGKRLENALSAARGMIERLRDGDVISLVAYDTTAEVKVAATQIDGRSRFQVLRQLDDIVARGDTCISCGLEMASELLSRRSGMVDQVLLLSDGEATAGTKEEAGFRELSSRIHRQGATISTIGVDVDYNEQVMSAIAEESNGRHHFVENAAALAGIFDEELKSLANTVADETELTVSLAPGVQVLEVYDRSFRREGELLKIPVGAFSGGDERTFLMKVLVPAAKVGVRPVVDVHLAYRDLTLGRAGSCEGSLSHVLVGDPDLLSPLDPLVANRVERSETAAVLAGANQLAKEGKADEARDLLHQEWAKKRAARPKILQTPFQSANKGASDLEADLDRQEKVLAKAEEGFATPPGAAPAPESHKVKAAVRVNQSEARAAGF